MQRGHQLPAPPEFNGEENGEPIERQGQQMDELGPPNGRHSHDARPTARSSEPAKSYVKCHDDDNRRVLSEYFLDKRRDSAGSTVRCPRLRDGMRHGIQWWVH